MTKGSVSEEGNQSSSPSLWLPHEDDVEDGETLEKVSITKNVVRKSLIWETSEGLTPSINNGHMSLRHVGLAVHRHRNHHRREVSNRLNMAPLRFTGSMYSGEEGRRLWIYNGQ